MTVRYHAPRPWPDNFSLVDTSEIDRFCNKRPTYQGRSPAPQAGASTIARTPPGKFASEERNKERSIREGAASLEEFYDCNREQWQRQLERQATIEQTKRIDVASKPRVSSVQKKRTIADHRQRTELASQAETCIECRRQSNVSPSNRPSFNSPKNLTTAIGSIAKRTYAKYAT
ncbi:hypothetical protein R1flu_024468 [Riccia fluitans]|uniref:Uncharacterized protein n=1 Tax=Riccia fluitans TaxID=41844 RepID=A0ABD1XY10_9MARC